MGYKGKTHAGQRENGQTPHRNTLTRNQTQDLRAVRCQLKSTEEEQLPVLFLVAAGLDNCVVIAAPQNSQFYGGVGRCCP